MSRSLPSRPNLEHLRKQAKDLLDTARTVHPSWQLADAQFALARGYGFPSWPALKAHVETSPQSGDPVDVARHAVERIEDDCPLNGMWVANLEESVRHTAFQFRSATLEVRASGTRVSMTQVVIDAVGQKSGGTMEIVADGQPHTSPSGQPTHALVARWLDARTLEAIDRKDDVDVGRGRYEVTPDGGRLIVTTAEQRLVFDRR